MRKRILSILLSASMTASLVAVPIAASAEANTPTYQTTQRKMEKLNRGLVATYRTKDSQNVDATGVYLSWRLLGDEPLETQEYDIYKNDEYLTTTTGASGTNYVDEDGTKSDTYKVVKAGASATDVAGETAVTPGTNHVAATSQYTSLANSFTYVDIPIVRPDPVERMGDGSTSYYYTYDSSHEGGANDGSVGDLDGDGDYELVLKWDPTDSKDSAGADYTGNVYIDAYELDPDNEGYMWRIDLGQNVTAGAHYTQFIVYDFDGNGKSEIAMKTAPGTIDGQGNYVSEVGDTDEIRNVDNTASFVGDGSVSGMKGKNPYTQYLTIFDGETGAALATTKYIPYDTVSTWGDSKFNRSERYLAGVAYLDGVTPSIIMCRGYYKAAVIRAYNWDGSTLTMQWQYVGSSSGESSLYGQGNHNLSIGDIDGDGCDEIVYGSAALDNDGKTVMGNTQLGHGDAIHMSDFNNDGEQEVFSVKEESEGYSYYAQDLRNPATGEHFWDSGLLTTSDDNGRGVMDNIDDAYAAEHSNALALGWSSGLHYIYDLNGEAVNPTGMVPIYDEDTGTWSNEPKPASAGKGSFDNFLVYWDGDLGRELLDANIIQKYDAATSTTTRFWGESDNYTLTGGSTNNYTKRNYTLVADIWGDWREEIIMPINKDSSTEQAYLRVFTSTIPTEYRLTTLMHDSQYRMSVAWQNVAYNQPTHTSYYVGSAALATDESGATLNYLAPAVAYTNVTYSSGEEVAVTGLTLSENSIEIERTKSYTLNATLTPTDATTKGIIWTSSDTSVATVANGVVKGVGDGTATITATSKDDTNGTISASCTVEVYSTPVTSVTLAEKSIDIGMGYTKTLSATVKPTDATDTSLTWTSADETIATVDEDGVVTGVSYGKTTITATNKDSGKSAQCIVKVKPIDSTDMTGDGAFHFNPENSDANTSLDNNTASSATLTLNDAATGATIQKDFETTSENKATLYFHLVTGGQKYDGSNWNWTGHEYTMGLKLIDADGNNILTVEQPYASSAGTLTSQIGDTDAVGLINSWTTVVDSSGYVQGSAKRWMVTLEFDYNNDVCNATIAGTDSDWTNELGKYTTSFSLNGASLASLQLYTTQDGTGTIKAAPAISNLSYVYETTISGETEAVYESGTTNVPMTSSTVEDWVQTGTDTAELAYDSTNDRVYYNPTKPGAEYTASKTFEFEDNAIVTYDIDWYFCASTGRAANREYLQFGSDLRLGAMTDASGGYYVLVSTDGGASYNGLTEEDGTYTFDSTQSLFSEADKNTYTKNVKVIFDTSTNTIKSLVFDGKTVDTYTDFALSDTATVDTVTFGFERGGSTSDWEYINGIDSIKVTQFIEGEEIPDFSAITITGITDNAVNVDYDLVDYSGETARIIGALYDADGTMVEVKAGTAMTVDNTESIIQGEESITFTNDPTEYNVKMFLWDSVDGMQPIADTAEATSTTAPTATPTVAPTATPTATPTPTPTIAPTINPDVTYEEVFTSSENFLMADDTENNKWIVSSDGTVGTTAVETSDDIGGNDTAKLYLVNKAVQYVLNDAITEGCFKLTYDMYIDKTTNPSGYGRYFRTYLDNAAHDYDATTGKSSANDTSGSFFHMMDYYDAVYTTSSVDLLSANQNSSFTTGATQLSETALEDAKWYRVVIEGDLDNDVVIVSYYAHGDSYNVDLDISTATPVISANGCFTADRTRSIKQIKLMRTAGGDLYYDNIKLEKETADTTGGETETGSETDNAGETE
ncbi:MAG: Ig-like domain-containing protein [Oscillospiraceae bacterium]|nr:Ig-like domain-containing protein [Oscillospiraceae bacterium]